jgi:hypothetical protein
LHRAVHEEHSVEALSDLSTQHPLLSLLDALVRRDAGPSGFGGALAIGVLMADGVSWWEVQFGPRPQAQFVGAPDEAGTWLLLGERDADAILQGGSLAAGSELLKLAGDPELVQRFSERYIRRRSAVDLRSLLSSGGAS